MEGTWSVGQCVSVDARTTPGINRPGGVGKITKVHYDNGYVISVDVKYVLSGFDKHIDLAFVHPTETLNRQSRSRRGRDFYSATPAKRGMGDEAEGQKNPSSAPGGTEDTKRNDATQPRSEKKRGSLDKKVKGLPPSSKGTGNVSKSANRASKPPPMPTANKAKIRPSSKKRRRDQQGKNERRTKPSSTTEVPKILNVVPSCVSPLECPDLAGDDTPIFDSASPVHRRQTGRLGRDQKEPKPRSARRMLQSGVLRTFSSRLKRKPKKKAKGGDLVDLAKACTIDDDHNVYKTPSPRRDEEEEDAQFISQSSSDSARGNTEANKENQPSQPLAQRNQKPQGKSTAAVPGAPKAILSTNKPEQGKTVSER